MWPDQRPTLTPAKPKAGSNRTLERILVSMYDHGTGLNLEASSVVADFPIGGKPAGTNHADQFQALPGNRWELPLKQPPADPLRGKLTVSVKDKQGNITVIDRGFGIDASG